MTKISGIGTTATALSSSYLLELENGAGNSEKVGPALLAHELRRLGGPKAVMVKKSADQTGANYSAGVNVVFDSEIYDLAGFHGFSSTVTITIASPGVVTWTAHGFQAGTPITIATTGALPTGLTAGTVYYILNPTANTLQLAASPGGAAINTSGTQSGTHTATNNSVIRMPAGVGDYLQLGCNLRFANVTASTDIQVILLKNGAGAFDGGCRVVSDADSTTPAVTFASGLIPAVAGDNFEINLACSDTSIDLTASVGNFWALVPG